MCSRHQPEAGTDSEGMWAQMADGAIVEGPRLLFANEPVQVQCGNWVERGDAEGFCALVPDHDGRCQPPTYEV